MKKQKTIWTVTQAYQDATDGNECEIHAYTEVCADKTDAMQTVKNWIREQIETHYENNDDWTAADTRKLREKIYGLGEERCGNFHFKWVNDYEHVAWAVQGHNV